MALTKVTCWCEFYYYYGWCRIRISCIQFLQFKRTLSCFDDVLLFSFAICVAFSLFLSIFCDSDFVFHFLLFSSYKPIWGHECQCFQQMMIMVCKKKNTHSGETIRPPITARFHISSRPTWWMPSNAIAIIDDTKIKECIDPISMIAFSPPWNQTSLQYKLAI